MTKSEKENQDILQLAVQCMFINSEEKTEILSALKEPCDDGSTPSAMGFLLEKEYLSQEKIDFLTAFKKYMDTKALDEEFAELAIANNFVDKDTIKAVTEFQEECYSKTEETRQLSEILLRTNQIALEHATAIMLVQNRISDDDLAKALDDLAPTETGKDELNKRFGIIALKKELVSLEQLNDALSKQKREIFHGQIRRHLHIILEESEVLSEEDSMGLLREQKQFEKRRMHLEDALSNYNSDIRINTRFNQIFNYNVSKDSLEAYVSKTENFSDKIKPYQFLTWLKQVGIKFGLVDDEILEDFICNKEKGEEVLIAKGYPFVEGKDESIEFFFNTDFVLPENFHEADDLPVVSKGDILAQIIEGKKGKPGKDVYGNIDFPPDVKKCLNDCGEGVLQKEMTFVADSPGLPLLRREKTIIVSSLQADAKPRVFSENIEAPTGDKYKALNLQVTGMVCKEAVLICNDLILEGDVQGGKIQSTGDVRIRGSVGNAIEVKDGEDGSSEESLNNIVHIFAQGKLVIKKNIVNARLETGHELIALHAEIISSEIVATQGITLLGVQFSETKPSVLQIGQPPDPKIVQINNLIDTKKIELKKLKYQDEIDKLENRYKTQITKENGHSEKNDVLTDLLQRLEESSSEGVQGLKQNQYPDTPENEKKNKYMLGVVKEANEVEEAGQKAYVEKLFHEEKGMYLAAKEFTKTILNDQESKREEINAKIEENKSAIEELELEIEVITLGRDFLLLKETEVISSETAMIKIKDQLAKGTIIKGQKSEMIIPETMHGVKMMEVQDSGTGRSKIAIEGYFA